MLCEQCKDALDGLERRVAALEQSQTDVEGLAERVLTSILPKVLEAFEARVEDKIEAASKKLNLVIIGAKEEPDDQLVNIINESCRKLDIEPSSVVQTFRDGKSREGRPRIAKIQFKNHLSRQKFLTGFRGIRGGISGAESAWVRPDLTFRQREADRELRAELTTRRANGESVKIYRGKIVPN